MTIATQSISTTDLLSSIPLCFFGCEGCHSWHLESFLPANPHHGWTWEDCRKDAITHLGSEEALEEYIARAVNGGQGSVDGEGEETNLDIKNDPPKPKQGRLF